MANTRRSWKQTLFTPVTELVGLRPPRRPWRQIVADAGLADEVQKIIIAVIKRARLWRYESADVADELVAHFHDGLNAGRSADDLIKNFGDVKTAAKLIKRAKMRSRPLLWHAAWRTAQAVLAVIAVYTLVALGLAFSKPSVAVDYYAIVNKTVDQSPESDRAWPIYRKAFISCDLAGNQIKNWFALVGKGPRPTMPGDPQWETDNKPLLTKYHAIVDAARLAADKPSMGLRISPRSAYSEEDRLALFGHPSPNDPNSSPYLSNTPFDGSLMHQGEPMKNQYVVLLVLENDMADAAGAHDADRIVSDYRAMLTLARQTREVDSLNRQMNARGLIIRADTTLAVILENNPDLFSRDQLAALVHLATGAEETCRTSMAFERAKFLDLMQRLYTDDGHGNGRMTRSGLLAMPGLADAWMKNLVSDNHPVPRAMVKISPSTALPLMVITTADRRELTEFGLRHFDELDAMVDLPMWELAPRIEAIGKRFDALNEDPASRRRLGLALDLLRGLAQYLRSSRRVIAFNDAIAVAIALEVFRRDHGQYPADLAALVPQYFPHAPLDHTTGKPLIYKIRDGKPLLYSRGLDGNDHGGTPGPVECWPCPTKTGDWVLYPVPDLPWS